MKRALFAVAVALAASCDFTVFHHGFPDGLTCASDNSCPPNGQQCTGEGICRFLCKTASDCLPENHGGIPNPMNPEMCDVDGFCRYRCQVGQTGGCLYSDNINARGVCDHDSVCRPPCSAGCGPGFTCDADGACRPR